jgi:hypothetical protein
VLTRFLTAVLIASIGLCSNVFAQAKPTETTKQKVESIGVGNKITVIALDGKEYYGKITRIDADGFQIYEVDLKHSMDFRFGELQDVKKGYGGKGYGGKRIRHSARNGLIFGVALIGGAILFTLIGLSHESDH